VNVLKSIETAVDSIKDIKRELLLMSAKMRELEFKVSETAKSQKHVETSCQVLSDMFDDVKNKSDKRDDLINKHTEQFVKHSQDMVHVTKFNMMFYPEFLVTKSP
jgi:LmbE family N-acetylglucosaminyl deacetylase